MGQVEEQDTENRHIAVDGSIIVYAQCKVTMRMKRYLPSGKIDFGCFNDGVFKADKRVNRPD